MACSVMLAARIAVMRSTRSGRSLTAGRPVGPAARADLGEAAAGAPGDALALPVAERDERRGHLVAGRGRGVDAEVEGDEPGAGVAEPLHERSEVDDRAAQAPQVADHQAAGLALGDLLQRVGQPRALQAAAGLAVGDDLGELPLGALAGRLDLVHGCRRLRCGWPRRTP